MSVDQWETLKQTFSWVWLTKIEHRPFDFILLSDGPHYLFSENFGNTDAIDLAQAQIAYLRYTNQEAPELEALDELIATLCRPARKDLEAFQQTIDWDGDIREPFNHARIMANMELVNTLPISIKMAILQYFEYSTKNFIETFGELFGADGGEPRYQGGLGWVMMLKGIAKDGTFGTFDQVCRTPVNLLWATILDDHYDHQAEKKAIEEANRKNN